MTPKEKAEKLFDNMMSCIDDLHKYPMCYDTAKQASLIAVNEILESFIINIPKHQMEFWEVVKEELLKK